MRRFIAFLFVLFTIHSFTYGQDTTEVRLDEVLELAKRRSLDAFKAKNVYLASYWEYRAYRSGLLPHASLQVRPFTFNRAVTQRYDINQNIEVFREQQTLNTYANLSVRQWIGPTGGEIFVDSDFNRLLNFNTDNTLETYSLTPFRIGVIQPIFAFNETKWLHRIEPVKFQQAKQEFILEQQNINLQGVNLYFELLLATIRKEIAESKMKTASELYEIGEKRFAILSIGKEDLLNLELTYQNAEIESAQASKEFARAQFNLNSFLRLTDGSMISPVIPSETLGLQIRVDEAVSYAMDANPQLLELQRTKLEAGMNLEKTIRENRLSVDLTASYGLNQQAEEFGELYNDLLDQELVAVDINVPLLDWGERRGRKEMALRRKEVAEIEITKAKIDFEQEVALKVIDFNLQERLVSTSAKSDTIAMESFQLTEKRFRLGQADVLKLTSAMEARQQARENYINNLKLYWQHYYEIQQLTLYDFNNNQPLTEDFDEIIASGN